MAEEGKKAELEKAASTAAPPAGTKDGVDIAAAAAGSAAGGGGGTGDEEAEGEDDDEPCPKVSGGKKGSMASKSYPYAKPQGEACAASAAAVLRTAVFLIHCLATRAAGV